jgi:hypothetical protein
MLKSEDEKVRKQNEENLQALIGAEEVGNLLSFESELDSDGKLIPIIKIDAVPSVADDKLFKYTEESVSEAIMMCYAIHPSLVKTSHKLFGSSGEEMKQIKMDFQNQTEQERQAIERIMTKLFKRDMLITKLHDYNLDDTVNSK